MDRLERLVNLVAALIDTPRPLTRGEIGARIEGYSGDPQNFRRNFERDKDLLRQMGFPVITEAAEGASGDEIGYRIPREQYELPELGLTDDELTALRLAASAVQLDGDARDAGSSAAVVHALRKLGGAVSGETAAGGLAAVAVEGTAAAAFAAVGERRRVRFGYRGEQRTVDPWRLSYHRGHWYLTGFDQARGEERMFRLDRVEGDVEPVGPPDAFAAPGRPQTAPLAPWRLGDEEEQTATLLVDADQAHWARQELGEDAVAEERPDGSVVFEILVSNRAGFRSFVLGHLHHAEVLGPPALRRDLISWLEGLV